MQTTRLDFAEGFRVVLGNARAQAAVMTISPGQSEGGPDNRHRGADQWLLVVDGSGVAIVEGEQVHLATGVLLLMETGDRHEIRNTGVGLLKTVSIYLPPAYDASGEETFEGRA